MVDTEADHLFYPFQTFLSPRIGVWHVTGHPLSRIMPSLMYEVRSLCLCFYLLLPKHYLGTIKGISPVYCSISRKVQGIPKPCESAETATRELKGRKNTVGRGHVDQPLQAVLDQKLPWSSGYKK